MADFLLWSDAGDLFWLALLLQREGHRVQMHVDDSHAEDIGRNVVPLAPHPAPGTKDTVVIFDGVGHGFIGNAMRQAGYAVIGGNPFDVPSEVDRGGSMQLAKAVGLDLPEMKQFRTLAEVRAFLQDTDAEWFFKVSGTGLSTAYTYNSPDPAFMLRFLDWAGDKLAGADGFVLQRKVDGFEVDTEGWFDGLRFVPGAWNGTLEEKHLLTGNLGPRMGCSSNFGWAWRDDAPIVQATTAKYADVLRAAGYVGPFSVNALVAPGGKRWFLENTSRLGFDASQCALGLLHEGNLGDTLAAFARGELDRFPFRRDILGLTQRVSTPPFPAETAVGASEVKGLPIDDQVLIDPLFFPDDIMADDEGHAVLSGRDGNIGCAGVRGLDLDAMRADVLEKIKALKIPHKQHRTDPVGSAEERWAGMQSLGYLEPDDAPALALGLR